MKRILAPLALCCAGTALTISNAEGSAFAVREDSAEAVGTAAAGAGSRADDPSTVYDNPAGMTQLDGNQVSGGGVFVYPTIEFHGSATGLSGPTVGSDGNNAGRLALAPNLYAVYSLPDGFSAGIAMNAPFGLTVKESSNFFGRYAGVSGEILSVNINPSLAYKISDYLSIGGGLSAQWFNAEFTQSINQGAFIPGAPDGQGHFAGNSWGYGFNLGVLAEPWAGTRVGLTYRSRVRQSPTGGLDFRAINPIVAAGGLIDGPSKVNLSLPPTTGLSVTQSMTQDLNVSIDAQWTQWHTFQELLFANPTFAEHDTFNFSDTWFTSLGATYQLTEGWTLRGGIGWDQSPVKDRYRDVLIPDQDRYMTGVGLGYKFSEQLSLDGSYAHYFATPASMNGSIKNTNSSAFGTVLSGTYNDSLDYLAVSVRYKF